MTDEEFEEFNRFLDKYFLNYKELSVVNGREYDSVILRDINLLYDKEDEEGNITYGILTIMKDRNVLINGIWDKQGVPYGQTKVTTYNEETEETIVTYDGEAEYPFNLAMHLKHTPDIVTYNEEGVETSRVKQTKFVPLHKFSGYGIVIEY
jgi:hypothetical protein